MTDEIPDPTISLMQETKAPDVSSSDEPKAKRKYSRRKPSRAKSGTKRKYKRHTKRKSKRGKRKNKPTTIFVPMTEGQDFEECFVGRMEDNDLFKTKADAVAQIHEDAKDGFIDDTEPTRLVLFEVKLVKTHVFKVSPAQVRVEEM